MDSARPCMNALCMTLQLSLLGACTLCIRVFRFASWCCCLPLSRAVCPPSVFTGLSSLYRSCSLPPQPTFDPDECPAVSVPCHYSCYSPCSLSSAVTLAAVTLTPLNKMNSSVLQLTILHGVKDAIEDFKIIEPRGRRLQCINDTTMLCPSFLVNDESAFECPLARCYMGFT